jgi:hypothetical protein
VVGDEVILVAEAGVLGVAAVTEVVTVGEAAVAVEETSVEDHEADHAEDGAVARPRLRPRPSKWLPTWNLGHMKDWITWALEYLHGPYSLQRRSYRPFQQLESIAKSLHVLFCTA